MIELEKELEFNNCVNNEIKQSVWKDAQNLVKTLWNDFKWCLKWGSVCFVILLMVSILCVLFGNMAIIAGNSTIGFVHNMGVWIGANYVLAGVIIVIVGIAVFLLSLGILYFSSKLETAIAECDKKWKEHSLIVDMQKVEKLKKNKENLNDVSLILLILAIMIILIGIGVACVILLIGLIVITFFALIISTNESPI